MTHIPSPQTTEDFRIRRCDVCHFDVNNTEWKLCRKQACPLHFNSLGVSGEMPHHPSMVELKTLPEPVTYPAQITLLQKRAFTMAQGMHCPYCRSAEVFPFISLSECDPVDNNKVTREMRCKQGHGWHEVFTLTGVLTPEQHEQLFPLKT